MHISWKVLFLISILIMGTAVPIAIFWPKTEKKQSVNDSFTIHQQLKDLSTTFPLYYPSNNPSGFVLNSGSLRNQGKFVSYSYSSPQGPQLVIAEQPRPPFLEEVEKTKEFNTAIGSAYIADLNGHTTGFIKNNKTLLIISNVESLSAEQFQKFMESFKPI